MVLQTDVGLVVRPKRYRAVLMDQDVLHRVSAPSAAAGGRPRYSLVWKLVSLAGPMYAFVLSLIFKTRSNTGEIACTYGQCGP